MTNRMTTIDGFASARSMRAALREGQVSATELLELHLERIASYNPQLNAIVIPNEERARRRAAEADAAYARGESLGILHGLPLTIKEYNALRSEILKRIEYMRQINSLVLVVISTIFVFGLQNQNATLILLYPALALFLSVTWSSSDRRTRELGLYSKTQIEAKLGRDIIGWEHFMEEARMRHRLFDLDDLWAVAGIFIGTEVLALYVGTSISIRHGTVIPLSVLLLVATLSVIFTGITLLLPYDHKEKIRKFVYAAYKQNQQAYQK